MTEQGKRRRSLLAAVLAIFGFFLICLLGTEVSFQTGKNIWDAPKLADLIVTKGNFATIKNRGRAPPSFHSADGRTFYVNCIPTQNSDECFDDSVIYSTKPVTLHYYNVKYHHGPNENIFSSVITDRGILGNDDASVKFLQKQLILQNELADKTIVNNKTWFGYLIFPIFICFGISLEAVLKIG
jgi:hypothetical protein